MTLNRDLLRITRKAIAECTPPPIIVVDTNFEEMIKDEMEFKSPIPLPTVLSRKKSILQINGKTFSFDAGVTDEPSDRAQKKRLSVQKVGTSSHQENYLIGRLLKVFYLEWTKSIFFKVTHMPIMIRRSSWRRCTSPSTRRDLAAWMRSSSPT